MVEEQTNISVTAEQKIWKILEEVKDPEVPVLSIIDLGIVRSINTSNNQVDVIITPTYSGCPALDVISMNIRMALLGKGYNEVVVSKVLSPAWSSDWISESGKEKLKAYGIAPPGRLAASNPDVLFQDAPAVQCPQCNSYNTTLISEFGSTACKSFYQCNDCKEPFDHFKCH